MKKQTSSESAEKTIEQPKLDAAATLLALQPIAEARRAYLTQLKTALEADDLAAIKKWARKLVGMPDAAQHTTEARAKINPSNRHNRKR